METPDEDMIKAGVQWWWMRYCTAEDHVCNEDAAYKRLKFVQGSLIPWFYGSHLVSYTASRRQLCLIDPQFTLSDGHDVYGVLMEFVQAQPLSSSLSGTLSVAQQEQLVCSPCVFVFL